MIILRPSLGCCRPPKLQGTRRFNKAVPCHIDCRVFLTQTYKSQEQCLIIQYMESDRSCHILDALIEQGVAPHLCCDHQLVSRLPFSSCSVLG
jgi:hypothetical protein